MSSLLGKIIETLPDESADNDFVLGKRMRALREVTGMTQEELASKLGISQSALSKLESRSDIHVSTVRHYVEALGATLRINAAFSAHSPVAFRIAEAFDVDPIDEDQLVLPIFWR